jgi:hypothetical protein
MTTADRAMLDGPFMTGRTRGVLLVAALVGLLAFVAGLATDAPRAWGVLLVNFLFWSGLGHAGVAFSALFHATSARWARPLKRVAEASIAFLPVSVLLLVALLAGVATWAPWVHHPNPHRHMWLNAPFFAGRELLALLLLGGISVAYVHASVRPDVGLLKESGRAVGPGLARWFLGGWRGLDAERRLSQQRQSRLAPALLIAYGCVLSLQAFDFVVALDPHWVSTLAGGYFFIGNLYIGVAFLAVVAAWMMSRPKLAEYVSREHLYDLGRLLLGFCMLWAYFFWAQYLVIWYGDLPEETGFVMHRTVDAPWAPLAWAVLISAFAIPFLMLLSREIKRRATGLLTVATIVLVAMWFERFILVVPSIWKGERLPIGPVEVFVTAGVGALFMICYAAFVQRVPILPIADPMLGPIEH